MKLTVLIRFIVIHLFIHPHKKLSAFHFYTWDDCQGHQGECVPFSSAVLWSFTHKHMGDGNINSQGYWDYKPNIHELGFPGGSAIKNLPANVGDTRDMGLIPGSGRFPGGENGNPLQCSCLENPMDRGAWWTTYNPLGCRESDMTE